MAKDIASMIKAGLNCKPEEFYDKYTAYKKAEAEFMEIYTPFKEFLLHLYECEPDLQNSLLLSGVKLTYVKPTTRTTIDTKKLKEEEPELAKKFTKTSDVKASIRIDGV